MITCADFCGYKSYTVSNGLISVTATELGATLTSVKYAGRETVLRYDDAKGYLGGGAFVCAAIGRYANRIGGSRFTLGGREYVLPANEGENQLHGGADSYDKRCWTAQPLGDNALRFTLHSPDGDNGFPGNLTASVTYTAEEDALRMDFEGECDSDTVYAPTSHIYFALDPAESVLNARLMINAERYVETGPGLIPTGALPSADGDFDFRTMRLVRRDYDDCFELCSEHACTLEAGGLRVELYTDYPGVQIYTGSSLKPPLRPNAGIAIEPEFFPDSPNRPEFASPLLKKGERFHKFARFVFSHADAK